MDKGYNLYNLEPQFREFLIAENISPVSLKNYMSDFRHFLGWVTLKLKSDKIEVKPNDMSFITKPLINDYRAYLTLNDLPLRTVNRRLSTLRKFCTFLISQGWITTNPAKEVINLKDHSAVIEQPELLKLYLTFVRKNTKNKIEAEKELDNISEFIDTGLIEASK